MTTNSSQDISKIESLLALGKLEEAKALIASAVQAQMGDIEKGRAIAGVASLYADVANAVNVKYRDALIKAIADIKRVDAAESKDMDTVRVEEVKKSLGMQ
jgi:hypothetical protein